MNEESPFGLDPDSRELWWLTQTQYAELLELLDPHVCPRKWWFLIAACLRAVEEKMPGPASRSAISLVEECAEGRQDATQIEKTEAAIRAEVTGDHPREVRAAGFAANWALVRSGLAPLLHVTKKVAWNTAITLGARVAHECHEYPPVIAWLRDIFGNPFCPVVVKPAWRTDTVLTLARMMYELRDYSAMPILADALQDAGCDDDDILSHCRSEGQHVRGCWVLDLVLEK